VNRSQRRHPLTGAPILPVGRRAGGRPIWPILGGDETVTAPPPQPALTLDDLRGKTPEQLYDLVNVASAHIQALHQDDSGALRSLDDAEKAAMVMLLSVREEAEKRLEEHRKIKAVLERRPQSVQVALRSLGDRRDEDPFWDIRQLRPKELRDQAMRRLDSKWDTMHMSDPQKTEVEKQLRTNPDIARRILVTEHDAYRTAFVKMTTKPDGAIYLTDDERQALRAFDEYRAMGEVTTTAGGFGVPVKLAA
jgi:hypothetical protein